MPEDTTMSKPPVPYDKVKAIAEGYRELQELQHRQAATVAELIRWAVAALNINPNTYRMRRAEGFAERRKIVDENRHNQELARLYLQWLATRLEDEGATIRIDPGNPPA